MQKNCRWHYLETAEQVAQEASRHILDAAKEAIKQRGQFKLVLAGGTTPEKIYRLLAEAGADWLNWYIYFGDERCLPKDHPDRNSLMASRSFLEQVTIPETQVFVIPAELGPEKAAECYSNILTDALPFDMVLLGMGEDGHTASLFPGHQHNEEELAHAVYNSPKPPPERVSISAKALSNTRQLLFLITGKSKREAVKDWRAGQQLPVAVITPDYPIDIYIDNDAFTP